MSKRKPAQNVEIADDDDELSLQSADKPGFIAWAEALETRISSDVRHSCVGRWLPSDHAVELLQTRGKMHSSMGFARGSARLLHPEEALYLIDEGGLVIVKPPGWKDPHAPPATSAQSTSAPVGNSEGGEAAVAQNAVNASCEPVSLDSAAKPERSDTSAVDGETHEEPAAKRAKIDASRSDDGPSVADIATEPVPGSLHGGESSAILHSAIVPDDAKRLAVSTTELGAPAEDAPMADSSVACSASDDNAPASSSEPPAGPAPASSATATVIEGMVAASEPTATSEAPAPATARPAPPPYKPFYKPDPTQGAGALPLQAAYELLLRHCSLGQYLAYSQLRAQGLLVFRHRKSWGGAAAPSASSSSGPGAGMAPTLLLPSGEPALQVTYDVYVRDGITNFKPSAPGPPDFFLLVVHSPDDPTPTGPQVAELEARLSAYMQAAREHQAGRVGIRPDLTIAQAVAPQVKCAIVSHTTVTFYRLGVADAELNVVRRGDVRRGGGGAGGGAVPAHGNRGKNVKLVMADVLK